MLSDNFDLFRVFLSKVFLILTAVSAIAIVLMVAS